MSSTSNKRHKYTAQFKLRVVQFAEKSSNSKAGREFGVNEKLVRDWRRNVDKLQSMPRKKCADRGKKCYWPALEDEVAKWVTEQRQDGYIVTRNLIRLHAQVLAQKRNVANFSGTNSWCTRFMKRRGLAIRQKTKIAQKLPNDLEEKIVSFQKYLINARKRDDYELVQIGNMDETPVWFDMPAARTVESRGAKTVLLKTTGNEKTRFTVVLSCLADGTKLKPMVIFRRKTMPKDKFCPGVLVHVHPRGWMDEDGVKLWIEKVWRTRPGGASNSKSLLVWDSFSAHLGDSAKQLLKGNRSTQAVIPGGLTSLVQPLDVCLNKPFKDRLREKWTQWMINGEKTFTPAGNMRAASLTTVCEWVKDTWQNIPSEMVVRSFKKCGISNAMDGTEDDMLWEDGEIARVDDNDEAAVEEPDIYDDRLTAEQHLELFGESDDEEEFLGF